MVRNLNVALDNEDFQQVEQIKDDLNLTWEQFVIEAAECLQEREG